MNIKNFARIVEILDRKSRFLGNAEYYYLHNAPRIVEIIVLHCKIVPYPYFFALCSRGVLVVLRAFSEL